MKGMEQAFLEEASESLAALDRVLHERQYESRERVVIDRLTEFLHGLGAVRGFLNFPELESLSDKALLALKQFNRKQLSCDEFLATVLGMVDPFRILLDQIQSYDSKARNEEGKVSSRNREIGRSPARESFPSAGRTFFLQGKKDGASGGVEEEERSGKALAFTTMSRDDRQGSIKKKKVCIEEQFFVELMELVCELVLARNRWRNYLRFHKKLKHGKDLEDLLDSPSKAIAQLQERALQLRMRPVSDLWRIFPRAVRDLSKTLGKKIDFVTEGGSCELDRQILECLEIPLLHTLRNAADHGIESPEERLALSKKESGLIRITARRESGWIFLSISDDGCGLDVKKIGRKALEKGLITQDELAQMSDEAICSFIFLSGFSTLDKAGDLSGRGVGMDAVREKVESIGGSVSVRSVPGKGAHFTFRVPLTLVLLDTLIVYAGGQSFAIPCSFVSQLLRIRRSEERIENIQGTPMLCLHDQFFPLFFLAYFGGLQDAEEETREAADALGSFEMPADSLKVVMVQGGACRFGIVVDHLFGVERLVSKGMPSLSQGASIFSENAILGNGEIALFIDPMKIVRLLGWISNVEQDGKGAICSTSDEAKAGILLFRIDSHSLLAVPFALLVRLECVEKTHVRDRKGAFLIQKDGSLLSNLSFGTMKEARVEGKQFALFFGGYESPVGFLVSEIVGIEEYDSIARYGHEIQIVTDRPGVLGFINVNGSEAEVLDISVHLRQTFGAFGSLRQGEEGRGFPLLLLIETSPFFRNLLSAALQFQGFLVRAVSFSEDAFGTGTEGSNFSFILSDVDERGIKEPDFALGRPDVIKIALTNQYSPVLAEQARQAGFTDCLSKRDLSRLVAILKDARAGMQEAA